MTLDVVGSLKRGFSYKLDILGEMYEELLHADAACQLS
jgi:hypothetical protein